MPETKPTLAQIADGWIEIESVRQLNKLPEGHYELLHSNGGDFFDTYGAVLTNSILPAKWHVTCGARDSAEILSTFIAYRPVPSYEEHEKLKKKCESCTRMLGAWQHKTLRDEIAMAAMPAISIHSSPDTIKKTARRAYDLADAMLEARKGGDTNAD